jgi:toxin ParE1/3/4
MPNYRLSNEAKEDLIRIHQYGVRTFGQEKADEYYFNFFKKFEEIVLQPLAYEEVSFIRSNYRRCVCGVDVIYFRVNKEQIEIMAIIGRQNFHG